MLWSAVYLPGSSPSTPSEESCTPYPASGSATEEPPICRLSKTRSYDDLPSACDIMVPCMNRRSSDPSLNDKWQDHRHSLELSGLGNPEEDGYEGDRQPLGVHLSMAAGVGEGHMENILQEATKEEGIIEELGGKQRKGQEASLEVEQANYLEDSVKGEEGLELTSNTPHAQSNEGMPDQDRVRANPKPGGDCDKFSNGKIYNTEDAEVDDGSPQEFCNDEGASQVPKQPAFKLEGNTKQNGIEFEEDASQVTEKLNFKSGGGIQQNGVEFEEDASQEHKNHNGVEIEEEVQNSPSPLPSALTSSCVVLEDSTDTLTEGPVVSWPCRLDHVTAANELAQKPENSSTAGLIMMGIRGMKLQSDMTCMPPMLSQCAFHNSECKVLIHCNRDQIYFPSFDGSCLNGDNRIGKPGLSRQNSSTNTPHLRNTPHKCPLHSGGRNRIGSPPEQQAHNHLDDDGMPLYVDPIQQRLRQIECGHQQEVETLKNQVQELRCRLENFFPNSPLSFNGEFADEVNSIPDTEGNRDPSCLSGCSTEPLSETSWEQVDKRDTEVTRWVPDHVAHNCYNCDSKFWLASRKHHCRNTEAISETWNCGNVFCSSCCNQKAPVPSQQLFEPSRVCKLCYTDLHPTWELENPIAATSN
ncbi:hypothetical protein XELAEV_18010349mg [Xenopus laevis]|nr:hypothetical protein XELAEV_18010349mg [Xenopus laevis]